MYTDQWHVVHSADDRHQANTYASINFARTYNLRLWQGQAPTINLRVSEGGKTCLIRGYCWRHPELKQQWAEKQIHKDHLISAF
jgi:hypothetical protein